MPYKNKQDSAKVNPWIGQVTIRLPNGQRKTYNHRAKTRREAAQWEENKKRELYQGPQIRSICLLEWANQYLEYSQKHHTRGWFTDKQLAFRLLFSYVDSSTLVTEFFPNQIRLYLEKENELKGGCNANAQRKHLHAAWEWGKRFINLPLDNPFQIIASFPEINQPRYVPPVEDFTRVLIQCNNEQDRNMLLFFYFTGARKNEVFRLRWIDVDFSKPSYTLWCRKNQVGQWKSTELIADSNIIEILRSQWKLTGTKEYVFMYETTDHVWIPFKSRQHWLPKMCQRAQVHKFDFHSIRHLFATQRAYDKVPLVEIQQMLRHTSISTTSGYIKSLIGTLGLETQKSLSKSSDQLKRLEEKIRKEI